MTDRCTKCARTESQVGADAKSLGLLQEFQTGVYTCCQIVAWADEQCSAWFEATQEDNKPVDNIIDRREFDSSESEGVLVPVRLRRQQIPWYRRP